MPRREKAERPPPRTHLARSKPPPPLVQGRSFSGPGPPSAGPPAPPGRASASGPGPAPAASPGLLGTAGAAARRGRPTHGPEHAGTAGTRAPPRATVCGTRAGTGEHVHARVRCPPTQARRAHPVWVCSRTYVCTGSHMHGQTRLPPCTNGCSPRMAPKSLLSLDSSQLEQLPPPCSGATCWGTGTNHARDSWNRSAAPAAALLLEIQWHTATCSNDPGVVEMEGMLRTPLLPSMIPQYSQAGVKRSV
ncbi:unnamed protein product [Coccothraustes coccothraustes]